jgi:hypothetical protein
VGVAARSLQPGKPFHWNLAEHRLGLSVCLASGRVLQAIVRETKSLDSGPVRNCQWIGGDLIDRRGAVAVKWFVQVDEFPTMSLTRIVITLRNPRASEHPGGIWELGDSNSAIIESAIIRLVPVLKPDRGQLEYRLDRSVDWQAVEEFQLHQLGSGGDKFESRVHRSASGEVHAPRQGFILSADGRSESGSRATPTLIKTIANGQSIGIFVPRFWENFPKSLTAKDGNIELGLFPIEFGQPFELQPGEQKTCEFWIATGDVEEVRETLDAVANPPVVQVDPDWICMAEVIPWLTSISKDRCDHFLNLVNQTIEGEDSFEAKRERIDEYGWRHFGDLYADHESVYSDTGNPMVSHYNNQYDVIFGFGVHYLQGGDPKYLELMNDLARHVIDIDIYHTDEDRAAYNHGLFWHTTHYVDAGLSTHRSYPRGTCGGGPSSGHAYSRGLQLYYCMTGDPTAREAVVKMGEWMIAAEDGSKTKYRWLAAGETGLTSASGNESYHGPGRGPGNAVEVLLNAFELTHERRFLDQAERLIRRVVHPDQDVASLDLLDVENKWFYLVFLQALGRYLEVKISMNEIDMMYAYGKKTLLRYADWMAEHEEPFLTHPEKLEYPNETWAAQDIRKTEVFQWAARHADSDRRARFLERASWFFKHAIDELNRFETKSLCRPVALLLTNGYSYEFFRRGGLDTISESPPAPDVEFPPRQVFLSQKSLAIRNAKRLVVAGLIVGGLLVVGALSLLVAT